MYVSGVLAAVLILQFFVGLGRASCPFYYKRVGKNGPFYVYILHMAVSVVLSRLVTFKSLNLKCLCVLLVSFIIYEAAYLVSFFIKHIRAKNKV
jgi:hypothetical protein